MLKRAQASSRFDAERLLNRLFAAYGYLAPLAEPGWRAEQQAAGPVVALNDIHALLTVPPAAAADYTRTKAGHRFTLPASTGSKGRSRLTVYDKDGIERVFVGVRFSPETERPHGDQP